MKHVVSISDLSKKQILSIGTHDGRSDFRRLVRINSTTEGVTTAISAYDGFIAEQ